MKALLIALVRVSAKMPRALRAGTAAAIATVLRLFARRRLRIARINLARCFPERSVRERSALVAAHVRAFAQSVVDRGVLWFGSESAVRGLVGIDGWDHWEAARASGRPILILAPHFVGLDAGWTRLSMEIDMVTMYQPQRDPDYDALLLAGRRRFGDQYLVAKSEGPRAMLRALAAGRPLYYLPDMDFGPRDAIFVPFFGVAAATLTTLARIAQSQKALVVPCVTTLDRSGHYCARFYPAWADFPGEDLEAATRAMNRFIEERVLEHPEQYLWTHQRFKTRPPGDAGFYR